MPHIKKYTHEVQKKLPDKFIAYESNKNKKNDSIMKQEQVKVLSGRRNVSVMSRMTNDHTQDTPDCGFVSCDAIELCRRTARKVFKKKFWERRDDGIQSLPVQLTDSV